MDDPISRPFLHLPPPPTHPTYDVYRKYLRMDKKIWYACFESSERLGGMVVDGSDSHLSLRMLTSQEAA